MLKILRKKERVKKIIFWILIALMVLAFALWGTGAYRQKSGPDYAGIIFGRAVSIPEFRKAYISCLNDARMRWGEDYKKLLPLLDLNNQAWMKLALLHHARKLKITVSDDEVVRSISTNPIFFKDDKFSRDTYERIARYYFQRQPREFEEETRSNLIIKKLYDELTKNVTVSDEEALNGYKQEFESVSINYIRLKHEDFISEVKPQDDELRDYYQKNALIFKMPPAVMVEYVGKVYPKDAKEEDKIKGLEEIKALYPKIKNAEDLKSIAQGDIPYGQTGFFSFYEPAADIESPEFNKWAFQLREKQTSPVIQTAQGAYVLRVLKKRDSYIPDFTEVKDKVLDALKAEKSKEIAKSRTREYKNKMEEHMKQNPGKGLKESGKELGLEVKTTEQFKRAKPLRDADSGINRQIQNIAFSLKAGQISDALETDTAYFLIEQDMLTGIDEEKFKEEKETFTKDFLGKKKEAIFNQALQGLMAQSGLIDYTSSRNLPQ
jgi:parvulin-like peptidyl-prolyl isomerase